MVRRATSLRRLVNSLGNKIKANRKKLLVATGATFGIATVAFVIAFVATTPPPANRVAVSFRLVEPYGGVFKTVDTCEARADFEWLNQTLTVSPRARVSPAPVITVEAVDVSRTSADACEYRFNLTIASPEVGPIDQIFGASKVPEDLGLYRFEIGDQEIGQEQLFRTAEVGVSLVKSISVTNKILGLYEIGDKWTSCTSLTASLTQTYPDSWNCTKRYGVSTGLFWWDISIYSTTQIKTNETTGVCSGLRSLVDFKSGATVTITGDNGVTRGKLVAAKNLYSELTANGINSTRAWGYYLYSKGSRVIVCPLAFEIADVPYSRGGYTIKVAGRPEFFVSAEDIEKTNWFVRGQSGDSIPGN
jgi:hypothetical protein